jgi:hypothetical protein
VPGRLAEVGAIVALALIVTLAMAVPVLRAPSERVFGMEIVGRHHDPFTVMEQLERPIAVGVYSQPVTDIAGALFARLWGGVAAYNWLVLLSFPLSAAAAYLLARHVALSPAGATVAAMAFAFSPFHLAHAAYHPQIAQTQWMPLYLLALWRCLDDASPAAIAFLGAATLAVTFSNFYGGLIAAVITPVAAAMYWFFISRANTKSTRHLCITVGSLMLIAAAGMAYASYAIPAVIVNRAAFAFPRSDLFRYSAKWWSYLVPPVANPLLGTAARNLWNAAGVREGLLEQQVSLGWGIVALGLIAVFRWLVGGKSGTAGNAGGAIRRPAAIACLPVLVVVAVVALVCSLSPQRTIGAFTFVRPAALLYDIVPMFRSYARFGVVAQLMAALLAGIGVDYLRRAGTMRAQVVWLALVAIAAGEYFVAPSSLSRDVLPTTAHRWIMRQPGKARALDCTPFNQESESVQWLTGYRVTLLSASINDCTEPNLAEKLAAMEYTHVLVRRSAEDSQWFATHTAPEGLRGAANFDDAQLFAITAPTPAVYTAGLTGFFPREHDAERTWRWMGKDGAWTIVNTRAQPIVTTLGIELLAFHRTRQMELVLDGRHVQTLIVDSSRRRIYQIGPLTLMPGGHGLVFHPAEAPTVVSDVVHDANDVRKRDRRALSFAFGEWNWIVPDGQP